MEPVDNNIYRYKYGRSQWEVYSTADPAIPGIGSKISVWDKFSYYKYSV